MSPDAPDGDTGNDRQDGRGGPRGERACAADVLSHAQLLRQGERAAWALTRLGLKAGDAVTVLLPMCLESVVVTLACVRLGVLRKTLPVTGCHASLRAGIRASGSRVVISAGSCLSEGKPVHVKARLDRALADCPGVRSVVVVPQVARPVPWVPGRDLWWHEALDHDLPPLPEPPGWEPGPEGAGTAPRTLGA
ncbi:AMP-binding protein [Streptomyces sp. 7-21]|uniref:AMP-binding protein n=1 Tax=Streptomyces sp. 7-21 TaxID=2802283 RepID=UPI00191D6FC4|nr:AMP-binding protein [Streptomyces sp. 7-21]MBL1067429.1 AMP-binding protein [Streptomyces sp. 7-21]